MQSNERAPAFESFAAKVVSYDDDPDQCTIFPTDVSEDQRTTTWISAEEGSYCSLHSCR